MTLIPWAHDVISRGLWRYFLGAKTCRVRKAQLRTTRFIPIYLCYGAWAHNYRLHLQVWSYFTGQKGMRLTNRSSFSGGVSILWPGHGVHWTLYATRGMIMSTELTVLEGHGVVKKLAFCGPCMSLTDSTLCNGRGRWVQKLRSPEGQGVLFGVVVVDASPRLNTLGSTGI